MQTCIRVVSAAALGFTGVETITGVTDARTGVAFTPTFGMVHGNSLLNAIQSQTPTPVGIVSLYWLASGGYDDGGAVHRGFAGATGSRFGLKLTNQGVGPYSIMSEIPDVFFGGFVSRQAYISAFRLGEFDITYASNDYTGDSFVVVLFGGSDLQIAPVIGNGTTVLTVGWPPAGALFTNPGQSFTASGGSACGVSVGWAARDSGQGSGGAVCLYNAGNSRNQSNTLGYDPLSIGFSATGLTFSGLGFTSTAILFGGTDVACASGSVLSPTGLGLQVIDLEVPTQLVYLSSVGAPHLSVPDTSRAEFCLGGSDGVRVFSHWAAESGVGNPPNGARFLSNQTILQFGDPATLASAITARAEFVSLIGTQLTINWTLNDGVARELLWFAVGTPNHTPDIPTVNPICLAPLPTAIVVR